MARRLRVSPLTVRRMVSRGDLFDPVHFGPGVTRWSADEYARWCQERVGRNAKR
jgi:predicted DNA-binding transcriptional regulator AlpA